MLICFLSDPELEESELASACLTAGTVVGISITILLVSFFAGVMLAVLITCYCMREKEKSSKQTDLPTSEPLQTVPVYAEVVRTCTLEMKENPAYELGAGKVEIKQNPSYGPLEC